MTDAASHMDSIYRFQRHIYDVTRKPYLLGRDVLIQELSPPTFGNVLEIGCGTARNLLKIAERYPNVHCHGVDVSSVMIETAQQSIQRAGETGRVKVALADACQFDPVAQFGVNHFDRVVISYALSMIPAWQDVLGATLRLLPSGGELHVVDFGDQHALPAAARKVLNTWLSWFSVTPRLDLVPTLQEVARSQGATHAARQLYKGYAVVGRIRMP